MIWVTVGWDLFLYAPKIKHYTFNQTLPHLAFTPALYTLLWVCWSFSPNSGGTIEWTADTCQCSSCGMVSSKEQCACVREREREGEKERRDRKLACNSKLNVGNLTLSILLNLEVQFSFREHLTVTWHFWSTAAYCSRLPTFFPIMLFFLPCPGIKARSQSPPLYASLHMLKACPAAIAQHNSCEVPQ